MTASRQVVLKIVKDLKRIKKELRKNPEIKKVVLTHVEGTSLLVINILAEQFWSTTNVETIQTETFFKVGPYMHQGQDLYFISYILFPRVAVTAKEFNQIKKQANIKSHTCYFYHPIYKELPNAIFISSFSDMPFYKVIFNELEGKRTIVDHVFDLFTIREKIKDVSVDINATTKEVVISTGYKTICLKLTKQDLQKLKKRGII